MNIKIFKDKKLEIDLPTFVDSRALICANSGGGKSYAVRKILEESSNKVMSIILDVEGEFRTLREKFDFLLIGTEGDVELNMKSANLIPKKIMELEVSTIIDISDLKRSERIRYVKEFLEALMELPRKKEGGGTYWKPCIVVLDEAHLLAGQQEKQDSCSAVIDLMTRGRKRGYCGVLCTQRISKLHKDAVAEANNIMIGRTGLDIDMKRASEILGFTNKLDMLSLRDLEAGEFFVFGTAISRKVIKAFVAEVSTTHPKVGMDLRREIIKPTANIIKILSKIKDLPKKAEKELRELKDYKKEVMELKRELRSKPKPEADERSLERAKQHGFKEAEKQMMDEINFLRKENDTLIKLMKAIGKLLNVTPVPRKEFNIKDIKPVPIFRDPKVIKIVRSKLLTNPSPISEESDDDLDLGICAKKIYSFLYNHPERAFTKHHIGAFTGYSHGSGGFSNAVSQLKTAGLIIKNGNSLQVLNLNSDLAVEYDFSKEAIMQNMGVCPKKIYQFLLDNPYESYSKEQLGEVTGYSHGSGGFSNAISKLNSLGLIIKDNLHIKLNPELLEIE